MAHLFSPEHVAALEATRNRPPSPKAILRLSQVHPPELVRWAFLQWELRTRARAKFTLAPEMLFVAEALEQATHEQVAAYHASRFPAEAAVLDLTAGIGGDSMAFGQRGEVTGYEIDPERAQCALHNISVVGASGVIHPIDGMQAQPGPYIWADPSRRQHGQRVSHEAYLPNPRVILETHRDCDLVGIKLSPGEPDGFLGSLGPEIEFISFGRECREAVVWTGPLSQPGVRARLIETGDTLASGGPPDEDANPGESLYDADPAVLRAGALRELSVQTGARWLAASAGGFLTGAAGIRSPWLREYRILEESQLDVKALRQRLEKLGSRTPAIKPRGRRIDVDHWHRVLRLEGERELAVLILGTKGRTRVWITESVGP